MNAKKLITFPNITGMSKLLNKDYIIEEENRTKHRKDIITNFTRPFLFLSVLL